jgi:hypothetical protein
MSADIINLEPRIRKYKFDMKTSAWNEQRAFTRKKSDLFTTEYVPLNVSKMSKGQNSAVNKLAVCN